MVFLQTHANSYNIGKSSRLGLVHLSSSSTWARCNWHPFLKHIFICKDEISLIEIGLGTLFTILYFPSSPRQLKVLLRQSKMAWCTSNLSIPMRTSYKPRDTMFKYTIVMIPFISSGKPLTIKLIFFLVPITSWTNFGFSCLLFFKCNHSTKLGAM